MAIESRGAVLRQIHQLFSLGTVAGMPEDELLERFVVRKDEAAFEALIVQYGPMVQGVCNRVLANRDAAEDAFQATFLVLLKKAGSIRDPARLRPWLYGVAVRVASRARVDAYRRTTKERDAARSEAVPPITLGDAAGVRATIDEELNRLPERFRRPLILYHLEGMSYAEAARRLECTEATVRGRLARAREQLRVRLTRRGLAPSTGMVTAALAIEPASAAVPAAVVTATVGVARIVALGGPIASHLVWGPAAQLAEGVLKTMALSKLKLTASFAAIGTLVLSALPIAIARDDKSKPSIDGPVRTASAPPKPAADDVSKATPIELLVVDQHTGQAMSNVALKISINGETRLEGQTDREGRYAVTLPGALTSVTIKARADGFVPALVSWVREGTEPIAIPKDLRLALERGTSIGGVVQDVSGRPITGATVYLLISQKFGQGQPRIDILDYPTVTDDSGHWRVDVVPSQLDDLRIRLRHPEYISDARYDSPQKSAMARLRDLTGVLVMQKGLPVVGRVLDQVGRPIAGATVVHGSPPARRETGTKTDADGQFRYNQIAPGDLILTVQAAGYGPELKTVKVVPEMGSVEFRLEPAGVLRGRVVDEDGRPVAGVWVVTDEWRGHRSLSLETKSGADGVFEIADAPADVVSLQFSKSPEFMNLPDQAFAPSDKVHVVKLNRPLKIRGAVVAADSGKPIETFNLLEVGDPSREPIRVDRDLSHRFHGGRYEVNFRWPYPHVRGLRIEAEGYLPATSRGFVATEGNQVYDFKLTPGTVPTRRALSGVVRLPDGSAAVGAEVNLATKANGITVRNENALYPERHPNVRVSADGTFRFPPQTEEALVLVLDPRGWAELTEEVLIAQPTITLVPWGRVKGTLRVGSRPGSLQEVYLNPKVGRVLVEDQRIRYESRATTNEAGHFTMERVRPGEALISRTVELSPRRHGFGPWIPIAVESGQTVELSLGGLGRPVTGRFIKATGSDVLIDWAKGFGSFRLKPPVVPIPEGLTKEQRLEWLEEWHRTEAGRLDLKYEQAPPFYPVKIEADGSFRIEDVTPGLYELSIRVNEPSGPGRRPIELSNHTVSIPEMPEGRSDVPIELGDVELAP